MLQFFRSTSNMQFLQMCIAQLAGAVEYTHFFSAEM